VAQVEATFSLSCEKLANSKILARGTGPDDITFPEQVLAVSGTTGTYNVQKASKVFLDKTVDYYEKFQIKWEIRIDDGKCMMRPFNWTKSYDN
jgi:hypothetical protein